MRYEFMPWIIVFRSNARFSADFYEWSKRGQRTLPSLAHGMGWQLSMDKSIKYRHLWMVLNLALID